LSIVNWELSIGKTYLNSHTHSVQGMSRVGRIEGSLEIAEIMCYVKREHQEWFRKRDPATGEKRCFEVKASMCESETLSEISTVRMLKALFSDVR